MMSFVNILLFSVLIDSLLHLYEKLNQYKPQRLWLRVEERIMKKRFYIDDEKRKLKAIGNNIAFDGKLYLGKK